LNLSPIIYEWRAWHLSSSEDTSFVREFRRAGTEVRLEIWKLWCHRLTRSDESTYWIQSHTFHSDDPCLMCYLSHHLFYIRTYE
jgi:hypothetical protein